MKFSIDPKIFEQYRDFKLGLIIVRGFDNTRRNSNLESLLRGICAQKDKEFLDKDLHAVPMVKVWEQAYGNFGINPHKYLPSIAALIKRIQKGGEIPPINPLVNLYNYFSLKYLLPIGSEDLDWLCGDLNLTYTKARDAFRKIGSIDVEEAKEGEVAYIDDGGITCRYWNHRECERTKITDKTTNAVLFIEDLSKMHQDKFGEILNEIQNALVKYIGGQIEPYLLTEENRSVDLRIQGRPTANDSKISNKEKMHYQERHPQNSSPPSEGEKEIYEPQKLEIDENEMLKKKIGSIMEKALSKTFPKIKNPKIKIDYPDSEEHGDYASNIALSLSKELKKSPIEIANEIISNIEKDEIIEKIQIAGPGFINFTLSAEILKKEAHKIVDLKGKYAEFKGNENDTVIIEYSQPNIAKPLGVHHLLSTIIGQSLSNIFRKLGFNTVSINYIGDWGTQFGKLIYAYKKWGNKAEIEKNPVAELLKLYIKFHEEAEIDPTLEDEARREFKIFEEGDKENKELWKWFVDESLKEIKQTYDKLGGISFDHYQGESFVEDKLKEMLKEGEDAGIFVEGEEGSKIVEFKDPNIPPFLVQKKDGATLYSTRDIATIKYRIENWHPKKIVYVVDTAQNLHFKQLFLTATRFPWYKNEAEHISFGRMSMKDKKMSTRKGNIVLLDEVLDEAVKRATKIVTEKNPNLENKEEISKTLGIGAVKYNILSQNRSTDIIFDWDRTLSLEGNSGPYLHYTYARAKSILNRRDESTGEIIPDPKNVEEKTRSLLAFLPKYTEAIYNAAKEYKPNILSNYLYKLAQKFNSFYNTVPVLKAENPQQKEKRLTIVEASSIIIEDGLKLLGIEVVERM